MRRFTLVVESDLGDFKHNGAVIMKDKPAVIEVAGNSPVTLLLTHAVNLVTVHERDSRLRAVGKKEGDLQKLWKTLKPRLISLISIAGTSKENITIKGRSLWMRWQILEINDHAQIEHHKSSPE